ncbi:MAG: hypothetical protein NC541_09855 [bacterium]|nr:hypothetical protein [bacterium]
MKSRTVWAGRLCLLAAAAGFIGVGLMRGEHLDVLEKAVRICLECIGIG